MSGLLLGRTSCWSLMLPTEEGSRRRGNLGQNQGQLSGGGIESRAHQASSPMERPLLVARVQAAIVLHFDHSDVSATPESLSEPVCHQDQGVKRAQIQKHEWKKKKEGDEKTIFSQKRYKKRNQGNLIRAQQIGQAGQASGNKPVTAFIQRIQQVTHSC